MEPEGSLKISYGKNKDKLHKYRPLIWTFYVVNILQNTENNNL
jgi:hypothetical protein